jgi:cysteinyl-tRNA synthetase
MKIYNSLTRTKEEFTPIRKNKVGIYVCGPTVYDEPHIGHARSAYVFDVIRRYLKYRDYDVRFVRNVTDVDDKIIEKARSEVRGQRSEVRLVEATREVAKKYLAAYHEDMALLGIAKPDKEPKATEYIPKMVSFVELLIKRGAAYEADGDVYFDIKKAASYGKLSNQDIEKMEAGASPVRSKTSNGTGEKKRDPLDFALWKKAKELEPSWKSPWGMGRPGWHIECSAMSSDILGDEFDIHGGGIDLIFPHHENEIAQSEGAGKRFAKYWMHNGLLTINGEKMAKSLGNFITIKDFLAKYRDADFLKLLFLNTHYRHPVDYSDAKIAEMKAQKERFVILFDKMERMLKGQKSEVRSQKSEKEIETFKKEFEEAMDDDFNAPLALAALFDLVTYANKNTVTADPAAVGKMLVDLGGVFGLDLSKTPAAEDTSEKDIRRLIGERDRARASKDFKKSDDIRRELAEKGVILEDTKAGTVWRRKL